MRVLNKYDIVLQEIPGEISISFNCVGCKYKCKGCHSPELWDVNNGYELTLSDYERILKNYKNKATCVLFMGGEWFNDIESFLFLAKNYGYKTALYTAIDINRLDKSLMCKLNYLKYGRYNNRLGGLDSIITNQILLNLDTNEKLNHYFLK